MYRSAAPSAAADEYSQDDLAEFDEAIPVVDEPSSSGEEAADTLFIESAGPDSPGPVVVAKGDREGAATPTIDSEMVSECVCLFVCLGCTPATHQQP